MLFFSLGKLDIRLVRLYTAQLVHTLEYMQGLEIMHRDLKPQNLMLDENFNIKIVSKQLLKRLFVLSIGAQSVTYCLNFRLD
jgi:serine/threonine protein kinase